MHKYEYENKRSVKSTVLIKTKKIVKKMILIDISCIYQLKTNTFAAA